MQHINESPLTTLLGVGERTIETEKKEQKTCKNILLEKCEWIFKKVYEWKIGCLT